ncbi:MAG: DUF349 domain-containing protein [Fibrobacter sp.]|nr:DUF349 domain-containing protein [Fibrobacter sp.]
MSLLDFFRPKWRHSNPTIRINAIRNLDASQQEIFIEVIEKDAEVEVRRVAVQKLNRIDVLRKLLNDEDAEIREIALQKVQEEYAKVLRNFEGELCSEYRTMLADLEGAVQLDDLLRNARSEDLRHELLKLSPKNSTLSFVALRDESETVALAAVEMLESSTALQEVADNSRHVKVRQFAHSQLKPEVDETEENEALELQKQQAVISHAQRLLEKKSLVDVQEEFAEMQKNATALGMGELQGEFDDLVGLFQDRLETEIAELAQEEKRQAEKAEQLAAQKDLVESFKGIVSGTVLGRESEVKDLQTRWEELKGAENTALAKKFNEYLRNYHEQMETMRAARQNEEKMTEWRSQILTQMEQLQKSEDLEVAGKQIQKLIAEWEKLPVLEGEDPEQQKFTSLQDSVQELLQKYAQAREQEIAEQSAKLQDLISQVKAIDEKQDFKEISIKLREISNEWRDTVGEDKFAFQDLWHEYRAATAKFEEMKEWEFWRNEQERDTIIESIKELLNLEDGSEAVPKLRSLQQAWRDAGYISQNKLQDYWDQYKDACDQVAEKFKEYFVELEVEREENLAKKIALCERVEAINNEEGEVNWREKSREVQALQKEWKEIGSVPREQKQELWGRFRTACDIFFKNHKEYLSEEDESRQENLTEKISLCEQAEAVQDSEDWNGTTRLLRNLQKKWKEIGPVPRANSEEIWTRFRSACDKFFDNKRAYYETLDQEKEENLLKKQELCEKLENMDLDAANPEVVATVEAIENEWNEIGMVPKDDVDSIWDRFSKITDDFLQARAELDEELATELENRSLTKKAMIEKVRESIDDAGASQTATLVRNLQGEWKDVGRSGAGEQELFKEFRDACDAFFTARRDQLDIQEQARRNNLHRKELLVEQAERILASDDLNESSLDEIKHLRRLWREVGSVPRRHSDRVWKRFNKACDAAFAAVRGDKNTKSNEGGE